MPVEKLRIALDITHPAHFHFFRNAVIEWREHGHDVLILSRDKDLTLQLLDEAGWDHRCLSRVRRGMAGLGLELVEHSFGVWRALRQHRSQVVAAIGGTFIVHPARLLHIPSMVFYDTENATLSNRITYPAATRIFTPRSYRHDLGPKHERYDGFQELPYLHPRRFTPDASQLEPDDLKPGDLFTFVRLVAWGSHHDVHDYGVQDVREVIERLEQYGRVLVSSESPLPADLRRYERRGPAGQVHHVLAFARLCFGESATMVSEAAQLGVPGVFLSTSSRGYTDELEQRYGMVFNFNGDRARQGLALDKAESILADPNSASLFRQRHAHMMTEQIDVTGYIVEQVECYARESGL